MAICRRSSTNQKRRGNGGHSRVFTPLVRLISNGQGHQEDQIDIELGRAAPVPSKRPKPSMPKLRCLEGPVED